MQAFHVVHLLHKGSTGMQHEVTRELGLSLAFWLASASPRKTSQHGGAECTPLSVRHRRDRYAGGKSDGI